METPFITIIIVTYNAANTLQRALESISRQANNIELIIIDGGSTDSTIDIILSFHDLVSLYVSEPDLGIYDAMNKGIDRAKGQWIYFLGADDLLQPDILSIVNDYLDDKFSIVYGDIMFDTGAYMKSYLGWMTFLQNTIHHQSAFYHRSLFKTFRYDNQLRTIADYELNLLVYMRKFSVLYIPVSIAICQTGGASSDWQLTIKETNHIRERYIYSIFLRKVLSIILRIYYLQKIIRNKFFVQKVKLI